MQRIESKQIMPQMPKKSIEQVIDLINEELGDSVCPISSMVPIMPFHPKKFDPLGRFTPDNFELTELLRMLIVFQQNRNPLNRQELKLEDIGSALTPNFDLIRKVDKLLAKHGYTRNDLLAHYHISPELYDYMLSRYGNKKIDEYFNWIEMLANIIDYYPKISFFFAVMIGNFEFFNSFKYYSQTCDTQLSELWYQKLKNTFVETTIPNYGYYRTNPIAAITSRNLTQSPFCEAMAYSFTQPPTSLGEFSICKQLDWKYHSISNSNSTFLNVGILFSDHQIDPRLNVGALVAAVSTTYIAKLLARNVKKASKTEKLCLGFAVAGLSVIGFDLLTGQLGYFNFLSETNAIRNACAHACNAAYKIVDVVQGQSYTFTLTSSESPASTQSCYSASSVRAVLTSGAAFLISRMSGLWCRKRRKGHEEYDELVQNNFQLSNREHKV